MLFRARIEGVQLLCVARGQSPNARILLLSPQTTKVAWNTVSRTILLVDKLSHDWRTLGQGTGEAYQPGPWQARRFSPNCFTTTTHFRTFFGCQCHLQRLSLLPTARISNHPPRSFCAWPRYRALKTKTRRWAVCAGMESESLSGWGL